MKWHFLMALIWWDKYLDEHPKKEIIIKILSMEKFFFKHPTMTQSLWQLAYGITKDLKVKKQLGSWENERSS